MKPIVVCFPVDHDIMNPMRNEVIRNCDLLQRLRSRGVPVVGSISVIGVEYGQLAVERDRDFNEYVFTWSLREGEEDPAAGL